MDLTGQLVCYKVQLLVREGLKKEKQTCLLGWVGQIIVRKCRRTSHSRGPDVCKNIRKIYTFRLPS